MKDKLEKLRSEINLWFDNISEKDIDDFEEGKPFYIMVLDRHDLLRVAIFLEKHYESNFYPGDI